MDKSQREPIKAAFPPERTAPIPTTATQAFNPARFTDSLRETLHRGWAPWQEEKRERTKLVRWLRKKFRSDKRAQDLADKLDCCKPRARCKSAACPECSAAAQRLYTKITKDFLLKRSDDAIIVCISVVPADGTSKRGHLSKAQHVRNVRRWKTALGRAGVGWFIGATDLSFNEHKGGRYLPHWSEHFYGFTEAADPEMLKRNLRRQFPTTDAIARPVKITEWDGRNAALRYAVKDIYWRRIGTDDGKRFDKRIGTERSCRATDKQPLRSSQKCELVLHLDDVGLQGRLLLRQAQFLHLGQSGPAIVRKVPKQRRRRDWGKSA
jgi:hypothetical protein